MRIDRLDLIAYGGFENCTLDFSGRKNHFHIVYGANESGKSTTMRAINAWLFGYPHKKVDHYVHDSRLAVGGRVCFENRGLEFIRRRSERSLLRDFEGEVIEPATLEMMLGGITQSEFETRFGLSHDELVKGGEAITNGGGDLGELLFSAGAGIGDLRELLIHTDQVSGEIFKPRGKKLKLNEKLNRYQELVQQLRQKQVKPADYQELQRQVEAVRDRSSALKTQLDQLKRQLLADEKLKKAIPKIPSWKNAKTALEKYDGVVELDPSFAHQYRDTGKQFDMAEGRIKEIESLLTKKRNELQSIVLNQPLLNHGDELSELIATGRMIETKQLGVQSHQQDLVRQLDFLKERLGRSSKKIDSSSPQTAIEKLKPIVDQIRVSDSDQERIHSLSLEIRQIEAETKRSKNELEDLNAQLLTTENTLADMALIPRMDAVERELDAIGNPDHWHERWADVEHETDALTIECQRCLRCVFDGLNRDEIGQQESVNDLSRQNPEALIRLASTVLERRLPSDQTRHEIENKIAQASEKHHEAVAKWRHESETWNQENARSQEEVFDDSLPDESALDSLRNERDERLQSLSTEALEADKLDVMRRIAQADRTVDRMRKNQRQLTVQEESRARLKAIEQRLQSASKKKEAAANELAKIENQREQVWSALGLRHSDPKSVAQWLDDRQKLEQTLGDLEIALRKRKVLQKEVQSHCDDLLEALEDCLEGIEDKAIDRIRKKRDRLGQSDARDVKLLRQGFLLGREVRELAESRLRAHRTEVEKLEQLKQAIPEARKVWRDAVAATVQWEGQWKWANTLLNMTNASESTKGPKRASTKRRKPKPKPADTKTLFDLEESEPDPPKKESAEDEALASESTVVDSLGSDAVIDGVPEDDSPQKNATPNLPSIELVLQRLRELRGIEEDFSTCVSLSRKIESIESEIASFESSVQSVSKRLCLDAHPLDQDEKRLDQNEQPLDQVKEPLDQNEQALPATFVVSQWGIRLAEQQQLLKRRTQVAEEIASFEKTERAIRDQKREADSMIRMLCNQAGCLDATFLPDCISKSDRFRELNADYRQIDAALQEIAGEESYEDLFARAEKIDAAALDERIESSKIQVQELENRWSQANQELGALNQTREQWDGGSSVADLSQDIEMLRSEIMDLTEQYVTLRTTDRLIRNTIEHYRKHHQNPVLQYAREAFAELTLHRYADLRADPGKNGKVSLSVLMPEAQGSDDDPSASSRNPLADDRSIHASDLSTGAADALYLALRIAGLKHHHDLGGSMPLIVDDCLVQLDDERTVAALKLFADLGKQTQVILFTHHQHLVRLANDHLPSDQVCNHHLGETLSV